MEPNTQRLMALGIVVLLTYGGWLLPRAWRSFDAMTTIINCGAVLAGLMALGQLMIGAVTGSDVAALAVIFYIGPHFLKHVGYVEGKIPMESWAAAAATVQRYRKA